MSRSIRTLIVGLGSIGERHLRCFAGTGRTDLSICEASATLGQQVADRYQIEMRFTDFGQAMAKDPELVVICTPAHLHVTMARRAAESGAAVLIEKPLSTSNEGIEELIRLADAQQSKVGVAYVYRCHPALRSMRTAIRSGRFGEPLSLVVNSGQHFPLYRPAYRDIYYKDRATGGGAVQDALTHLINAGEWLVGPIDRLVADVDHLALEGVTVEDTAQVLTRHAGVMGCFALNQHQAPNETFITVVCSKGTARFEFHEHRWRWMLEPGGTWHDEAIKPLERDTLFTLQAQAFLDCVEENVDPLCTLREAQQTLRVNLAILESAQQARWVSISDG